MKKSMSTLMRVLIGAAICLFPLIVAIPIFLSAGDVGVSGADAFKLSFHSIGYNIPLILGITFSIGLFAYAIINDWQEDFKAVLAVLAIWIVLTSVVFGKPAAIKTDPVGSSLSTEDINYLRAKGLNYNLK